MKLNRKGYMLVEIVIAAVLAFGIAYYLLNLTYKFKNTDADISESIIYENTKNVITKNIMNDLEQGFISNKETHIDIDDKYVIFKLCDDDGSCPDMRKLEVIKEDDKTVIRYGRWHFDDYLYDYTYDVDDKSYYEKELSPILMVGGIDVEVEEFPGNIGITIPITSIYDDKRYDIKVFARYFPPAE